jgi:hypothetical protein
MDEPDEPRDGLFARLSAEGREAAPIGYRFVHTSRFAAALHLRAVESRPYRASGYLCSSFRKPISKSLPADDE